MDKKEIKIKERPVIYNLYGTGEPVMLVHGFGEDSTVWRNQIEFLQNKFRLIVPDLPGSGDSATIEDMSLEGLAESLKIILDKEDISRCALIGHSMGGYVALAFAEKYGGWLNSLTLFHSTSFADSEEKKATRRKGIEFIQEHGATAFLANTTPALFSPITHDKMPGLIDDQLQRLKNFSGPALVSYYESMIRRPDRSAILRNSTIPVLFIAGKFDVAVPLSDSLKLCHMPYLSYIHILQYSGHLGMLEEAEKANQVLESFLVEAAMI